MLYETDFCFKADYYLPTEIRDEMRAEAKPQRIFSSDEVLAFLRKLPRDAELCLDYREAKDEWEYLFGKSQATGGKNVMSKAHFTIGAFVKGAKYGFASVMKTSGSTGALESKIIGNSVMHYFCNGERVISCPEAEEIADALMDAIMHGCRTTTTVTKDEWNDYHSKYVEDMLIDLGMAKRDLQGARYRWCVTDKEFRIGLVEIVRKQRGAIGLIVEKFPELWKDALDIIREKRKGLLDVQDGCFEGTMLEDDWNAIQKTRKLVVERAKAGTLMMYIGRAGTGKTHNALGRAADISAQDDKAQWSMVTLSNNVCANGAIRAKKEHGMIIEPFSIARCRYTLPSRYIIIDEFSQWGQETIRLFCDLLENSDQMIIMGDDCQINSFLGKGCLLCDVRELLLREYPQAVVLLKDVKRQADNIEMGKAITTFAETADLRCLEPWVYTGVPTQALKDWSAKMPDNGVIVSGSNASVSELNRFMFCSWMKRFAEDDEDKREIQPALTALKARTKRGLSDAAIFDTLTYIFEHNDTQLPVLMRDNVELTTKIGDKVVVKKGCKFCDGSGSLSRKFLTSEKAYVTGIENGGYVIENGRNGVLFLPADRAQYCIEPCFAITVNKAQGNEWDNVMVFMPPMGTEPRFYNGNLFNANAFYVAVSRPRKSLIIVPSPDAIQPFETFTTSFDVHVITD